LVSGPSTSPENRFYSPENDDKKNVVNLDMGNAMDQEIIWDSFTNFLEASKLLGINNEMTKNVSSALSKLSPPQIGSDGRLMEWSQEFEEAEPGHRHMSHLFGLHPGRQFSKNKTPKMIEAIQRSIDYRLSNGGGHTGWSRAWIINFFARLGDAEKAYKNVKALLQKSTSENLFDIHPPFQIDGNFGGTAGIAEMLLQSHLEDELGNSIIHLLPALPDAWSTGNVKGLCARGGYELDMEWDNGNLMSVNILTKKGGTCIINYKEKLISLTMKPGETRKLSEF
jgi:alpha-L-fucosidase 2